MKKLIAALAIFGLCASLSSAQEPGSEDWISAFVDTETQAISIQNDTGNEVAMLGFDVKSSVGGLKATGSGPFSITLLDTPDNVVLGNLENPFVLPPGASVKTDITFAGQYFQNPSSIISPTNLSGTWGNGLIQTRANFFGEILKNAPNENWVVGGLADGFITLTNTQGFGLPILGIEIKSSSDGLSAVSSAPFDSTVLDTPSNVIIENRQRETFLGAGASVKTGIAFSGSLEDLSGHRGGTSSLLGPELIPLNFIVPEPTCEMHVCLALLGLLGFDHRRKSR